MVGKIGRTIAIVVLLFLLVLSLGTANVAVGIERTALSPTFVEDTLEEEDAYAIMVEEAQSQLDAEAPTDGGNASPGQLLGTVVTESYLQNQTEANIERGYAYLEGDREDLYLAVDTTPLKEDLVAELATQLLEEFSLAEVDPRFAAMDDNESAFEDARASFKAEQKERIQDATPQNLSDEELEAAYDDRRDQIREEALDQLEAQVADSGQPQALQTPIVDLGTVYVEALVAADPSYEQFTTDVESARDALESAVQDLARERLDEELPDTMVLTEQLGQEERQQLDQVRDLVSLFSLLVYLLPLLAIGVALLVGWVTRTRSGALLLVGPVVTVIGLIEALGFSATRGLAEDEIATATAQGDLSAGLSELAVGIVDRTVSVFVTQSWFVVALGVVLIAIGIGIRRGLLPVEDQPGGASSAEGDGSGNGPPAREGPSEEEPEATDAVDEDAVEGDDPDEEPTDGEPEATGSAEEYAMDGDDSDEKAPRQKDES